MVIDYGIHVEAGFVGVLDLAHDLPDHVVVRLARRRLDFAIDAKSHASFPKCFRPARLADLQPTPSGTASGPVTPAAKQPSALQKFAWVTLIERLEPGSSEFERSGPRPAPPSKSYHVKRTANCIWRGLKMARGVPYDALGEPSRKKGPGPQ